MGDNMKHKKFLFMIILCLTVYLIYFFYHDDKINYLAIGDSLSVGINAYGEMSYGYSDYFSSYLDREGKLKSYHKDFAVSGYRITDLKHQLETNQIITTKNTTLSLKKSLRDAQLVTLSIGGNDLLSDLNISTIDINLLEEEEILKVIDHMTDNLDDLLRELRKYAKRDFILIGCYNPFPNSTLPMNRLFSYLNNKVREICDQYDIDYIDTYTIFKNNPDYLPNPTNIHPSVDGYEAIAQEIIKLYENKKL